MFKRGMCDAWIFPSVRQYSDVLKNIIWSFTRCELSTFRLLHIISKYQILASKIENTIPNTPRLSTTGIEDKVHEGVLRKIMITLTIAMHDQLKVNAVAAVSYAVASHGCVTTMNYNTALCDAVWCGVMWCGDREWRTSRSRLFRRGYSLARWRRRASGRK